MPRVCNFCCVGVFFGLGICFLLSPSLNTNAPSMSCCRTGTKSALSVEMEPLRSANDVGVLAPRPAICQLPASARSSWSSNLALLETGADTVCRSKESAHEPLMVPALLPQAVRSICCWTSVRAVDTLTQQSCSSTAVPRHCEVVWHSRTALIFRPQLALSQPGSRQVLWVCVVSCMGCAVKVRKKKLGSEKTPPVECILAGLRGSAACLAGPLGPAHEEAGAMRSRRD